MLYILTSYALLLLLQHYYIIIVIIIIITITITFIVFGERGANLEDGHQKHPIDTVV
jgi:hypothetical protein